MILFAESHGNRTAEREHEIDESLIRKWRKDRDRIFASNARRKSFRGPKTGLYAEIEEIVETFVLEERAQARVVTREKIRKRALEEARITGIVDFVASDGWCTRFMARRSLSLRRRTSVCQKLPSHFEEKLIEFQRYVNDLRTNYR